MAQPRPERDRPVEERDAEGAGERPVIGGLVDQAGMEQGGGRVGPGPPRRLGRAGEQAPLHALDQEEGDLRREAGGRSDRLPLDRHRRFRSRSGLEPC